jgi:hypothetical protein
MHRVASAGISTLILALLPAARLAAQQPQQQRPGCNQSEHRQFDFWIGEWDVTTPDGKPAGSSRITRILKDCVLHEEWKGAGGGNGESFNIWSRADGKWHQAWVADGGNYLTLEGMFNDGRMVLEGDGMNPAGKPIRNRITWQRIDNNPDLVRQFWEQSSDGGKTWAPAFDGHYHRKK